MSNSVNDSIFLNNNNFVCYTNPTSQSTITIQNIIASTASSTNA